MGNSGSTQSVNANYTGNMGSYMSSEQIKTAIKDMFRMSQMDNTAFTESLGFNDLTETKQSGGESRFISKTQRYKQFEPAQAGGNQTSEDLRAISSDLVEIQTLKDLINKQNNGQAGGGCPCADDMSATSPQPIDYSVLKGGAKEEKEENKDKKKKKKDKKDKKDKKEKKK